jgi:hypothetical protein
MNPPKLLQSDPVRRVFDFLAFRFHLPLYNRHQLRPAPPALLLTPLPKVNHIAVMGMGGAAVHLLAADIR